ncbi:MAG: hypothetical protein H0X57_11190 [Rubrobacter sp.]|nr:hypothetical protein [Rubrobacter sp.]
MKKEGTGRPQNPDIALDADVRMRELHFEEAPDPEVRFRGNTSRNSVWGSRRENLPDEVGEGVVYRDARVRLWIASEIVDSDPGFRNSSDKERVRRANTNSENPESKTTEQEPESRENKEKK